MKIIIRILSVLSFLISSHVTSGQISSAYLSLDRLYYMPGESVQFKAYFLNNGSMQTAMGSDSLHLVILDQDGIVVSTGIFAVSNKMITGIVDLPDFLTEGNYIVAGYTNSMKNLSPDKMFSRIIEIRKSVENYLTTELSLTESSYEPGSMLTAKLRFSGNGNRPVPASYSYQLNGDKEEILNGNNKANNEGLASLKFPLPKFDSKETLKLIVIPSYKGTKNITGVIIPTQFNTINNNTDQNRNQLSGESKHLNIQLKTANLPTGKNDRIVIEIIVTDDNGTPVMTNLAISASDNIPTLLPPQDNNFVSYSDRKNGKKDTDASAGINEFFTSKLVKLTQAPGSSFILQEKNNTKKLRKQKLINSQKNQVGYSSRTKKSPELLKNEENAHKAKCSTLFWEPDVMTDNSGKASINFIKNEYSGEILISVDGMAANGFYGSSSLILYNNGK